MLPVPTTPLWQHGTTGIPPQCPTMPNDFFLREMNDTQYLYPFNGIDHMLVLEQKSVERHIERDYLGEQISQTVYIMCNYALSYVINNENLNRDNILRDEAFEFRQKSSRYESFFKHRMKRNIANSLLTNYKREQEQRRNVYNSWRNMYKILCSEGDRDMVKIIAQIRANSRKQAAKARTIVKTGWWRHNPYQ